MKKFSKEQQFWSWFYEHSELYYNFESNENTLFSKLKSQLEKIHPDLVFEFSPILGDGTREFVISADGIKDLFPVVINLVKQAPTLKNWAFIALRQPHLEINQIIYENLTIYLSDVFFRFQEENGLLALELHIRGYQVSHEWLAGVFILLDNLLGEYHAEMSVGSIDMIALEEDKTENLLPIIDLPKIVFKSFNDNR